MSPCAYLCVFDGCERADTKLSGVPQSDVPTARQQSSPASDTLCLSVSLSNGIYSTSVPVTCKALRGAQPRVKTPKFAHLVHLVKTECALLMPAAVSARLKNLGA